MVDFLWRCDIIKQKDVIVVTESVWNEFRRVDFLFEGMDAILIFPKKPNKNKNWLLKTEYFGAFPNFQIEMLERGWHLASAYTIITIL